MDKTNKKIWQSGGNQSPQNQPGTLSRRGFLGAIGAASMAWPAMGGLVPIVGVDNPLGSYPDCDWERIYRDQYHFDRTFTWICAPNDTHMCRMRAYVRNGVMIRSEQPYDVD